MMVARTTRDELLAGAGAEVEAFVAHVAHDFNNLLAGILGNLELMQRRAAREGDRSYDNYLEGAASAGQRAALFVRRLLLMSGGGVQGAARLPVNELLRAAAEASRARGAAVVLEPDAADASLFCNAELAEQALEELLTNAAEASAPGEPVIVSARTAQDCVEIIVRDQGPGMAPDIAARAEEIFFTTHAGAAGRGLGLAIVARFVRGTGGTMRVETTQGAGCAVTLRLPPHP